MPSKDWLNRVLFGSSVRVFALASQFAVLFILSRFVKKDVFGDMMVVFAFYRMTAYGLGTGLGNMILFHVGRSGGNETLDIRLHRTATLWGILISSAIAALCASFAPVIAANFAKPGMAEWLVHMAPFMILSTLNLIATGSLDGRARVTSAIIVGEMLPNGIRLLLFPLIVVLHLPTIAIADAFSISVAVPWIVAAVPMLRRDVHGLERLTAWDGRYAGLYSVNMIISTQLQGLDMLVAGALFSSETVATYAIASRIAVLFPFFQQIILRNFTPRAGLLISLGDMERLNQELIGLKRWSVIAVSCLTGAVLVAAPFALPLFGHYLETVPLLAGLALPAMVRSLFAGNDVVLKMSGRAGFSFAISFAAAACVVIGPAMTHHLLGIYAIPTSMLIGSLILNPIIAARLAGSGVTIVDAADIPVVALGALVVAGGVFVQEAHWSGLISGVPLLAIAVSTWVSSRGRAYAA